jgi:Tol biopolymer transport system component
MADQGKHATILIVVASFLVLGVTGVLGYWLLRPGDGDGHRVSEAQEDQPFGTIAFLSDRDFYRAGFSLYELDPRTAAVNRLVKGPFSSYWAAWSPGGQRIAFDRGGKGRGTIVVYETRSAKLRVLPIPRLIHPQGPPAWSPHGRRLAFYSGSGDLWIIGADGRGLRRLTDKALESRSRPGFDFSSYPQWTKDGRSLLHTCLCGSGENLYLMDIATRTRTKVTDSGDQAVPSPSGDQIVFERNNNLFVIDADGGNERQLTRSGRDLMPVWSPDSRWIAFVSFRDENDEIYVMRADGSEEARLTHNRRIDYGPTWRSGPPTTSDQ